MDEQLSRERADEQRRKLEDNPTGSSQDQTSGQAGAKPDPQGTTTGTADEGTPPANAPESGPDAMHTDERTGEGTGARAGEYS
ncbi:MAG TPA: hypothetical protein VE821_02775 [Pyrinomonadaceae bacterium]|nr:hypothetical protein [Pyrinomonadaceae bacterium]